MLNLKMKMCKKYSNCWYELSVIGEIFFIIFKCEGINLIEVWIIYELSIWFIYG